MKSWSFSWWKISPPFVESEY